MALRVRFGPGDAARCRFAVSPLWETMAALMVLREPRRHAFYPRWLDTVRPDPPRDPLLDLLLLAMPVRGHAPDFLLPTPQDPVGRVEDELAVVAATAPEVVAAELADHARRLDHRTVAAEPLRTLTGDPVRARDLLVAGQRAAWQTLVEPLWERIRGLADAEIDRRSRRLADAGLEGLFADLHPRVRWSGSTLHLAGFRTDGVVDLRGRGMVLVPAAFGWPSLGIGPTGPSTGPPSLTYPMPGAGRLWETAAHSPAVSRLLGAGRALVLAETAYPATTTTIARQAQLAPATVSAHLAVLREAGLVTAQRRGREVHYRQTALGAALLRGRRRDA